jgi:GH24 family phage-related lysozyme (muramidase)
MDIVQDNLNKQIQEGVTEVASKKAKQPNIDMEFLAEQEGNKHQAYVPSSNSGVTIGMGFDLKEKTVDDLKKMGLNNDTINKFVPYLGLSGEQAKKAISNNPLVIRDQNELNELNTLSKSYYINSIARQYENASNGKKFVDLDPAQQTVLFSVGYQYGSLNRTPKFLKAAAEDRWQDVHKELMNFGDDFKSRRQREAGYLEKFLNK